MHNKIFKFRKNKIIYIETGTEVAAHCTYERACITELKFAYTGYHLLVLVLESENISGVNMFF